MKDKTGKVIKNMKYLLVCVSRCRSVCMSLRVFVSPGVQHVSGMIIYTASAVEAVNGTDVKLKCIFNSSAPVSLQSVSVAWYFQPFHAGREEAVFVALDFCFCVIYSALDMGF